MVVRSERRVIDSETLSLINTNDSSWANQLDLIFPGEIYKAEIRVFQ